MHDRRSTKYAFLIVLVFFIAFFLRIYKLNENFMFSGEFGDNLLHAKNYFQSGIVPLIGPPTSHPWLYFGPLYYWIIIPVEILFNWNPFGAVWFGSFVGFLVVVINFFTIRKLFNAKVALFSSLLIAISPLFISYSRLARFYFFVTPFFYFYLLGLVGFIKNGGRNLWITCLALGIMLNFHYSPLVLLPLTLIFVLIKIKSLKLKHVVYAALSFFLPAIPLFIHDSQNKFQMISKFVLWIPYRFAGFLGLYPKNNIGVESLNKDFSTLIEFLGSSLSFSKDSWLLISVAMGFMIYFSYRISMKKKTNIVPLFVLILMFVISVFAFFIHGDAPIHYFMPVFPVPIIIISYFLVNVSNNKLLTFVLSVIFLISFVNFKSALNSGKYYGLVNVISDGEVVFYKHLDAISREIINNSQGEKFKLKRVGENDQFEGFYAQNYQYILWFKGNEPEREASLTYTVFEDSEYEIPESEIIVSRIGNVLITKSYE